jgi:outer membrane lipoprotein-sorting protein
MRYSLFTILLMYAFSFNLNAAELSTLDKVRKNYNTNSTISFQFDLSIYWSVREKTDSKTGIVFLAPNNRFHVSIGDEQYISNGDKYWHYVNKISQVSVENLRKIDISMLPSGIFQQFLLKNQFIEKSVSGSITELSWQHDSNSTTPYKSIILWVDQRGVISKMQTSDRNDNLNTYTFHKTIFGNRVSSETFEFKIPKNVQVLNNYE